MPIANYLTKVPVHRSISEVQQMLVAHGAQAIMHEYGAGGRITGLSFKVDTPNGPRSYSLPVEAERVSAVLEAQGVRPYLYKLDHADRVAWRILRDWLRAQLAIIETEMVELDQVMLPYMLAKDGATVYQLYADQQLALGAGE